MRERISSLSGEKEEPVLLGAVHQSGVRVTRQWGDVAGSASLGIRMEKATFPHQAFFLQNSAVSRPAGMQPSAGRLVYAAWAGEWMLMVRAKVKALWFFSAVCCIETWLGFTWLLAYTSDSG